MICRKTMADCQTPGMCSPFGGCQDPVQSQLAALREELATSERDRLAAERRYEEQVHARDQIATNYNQLSYGASICKDNLAESQKRLADAERRNESLSGLLRETSDYLDGSTRNAVWCDSILHKKMKAALNKPEEAKS